MRIFSRSGEDVAAPLPHGRPLRRAPSRVTYACDASQDVCPFNGKFAQELREPAFAAREALAGKDARTLARDPLQLTQEELSAAYTRSPITRAKLRGLKRNAAVALGNIGTADNADVLTRALDDAEQLVRSHVAWALGRIDSPPAEAVLHTRLDAEPALRCASS